MTPDEAIRRIHAILYHDGPATQWSVGMLEDIADIVLATGITDPNPGEYFDH